MRPLDLAGGEKDSRRGSKGGVVRGREGHRHSETERRGYSQEHKTQDEMEQAHIPWTTTVFRVIWQQHIVHRIRGRKAKLLFTCGSMGLCMLEDSDEEFPFEYGSDERGGTGGCLGGAVCGEP